MSQIVTRRGFRERTIFEGWSGKVNLHGGVETGALKDGEGAKGA